MIDGALVIGYGNELRGDDGIGPHVARAVAAERSVGLQVLAVHQLTPELAEPLSRVRLAVFVDASMSGVAGSVVVTPLCPATNGTLSGHVSKPACLLGLAETLYGHHPEAWLVTIAAVDVGLGETLSPEARSGVSEAVRTVCRLLDDVKDSSVAAMRFHIQGRVQGVGYRPFVLRRARALGLAGWVANDVEGVVIHVEGAAEDLQRFSETIDALRPPLARVAKVVRSAAVLEELSEFTIRESRVQGKKGGVRVPADRALCDQCRAELDDARNRRFGHPLITCVDCGPRYSIIESMPFDRPATALKRFTFCGTCQQEYDDPVTRRCHAQTISCHDCGPQVSFARKLDDNRVTGRGAIERAAACLKAGEILALKGVGGFQLLVRADQSSAVRRLRQKKSRPSKPFAVMAPSLEVAELLAFVGPEERRLLTSLENPIVLLKRRSGEGQSWRIAPEVAPRLHQLGVFLPSTALHHLLLGELDFAVVATSGNRSDEPILTDENAPDNRLGEIADAWLVHDRPIHRRVDDSVMRVVSGRPVTYRSARGLAPHSLPALENLATRRKPSGPVLATGGHQKVAMALWNGTQAVLGPHIGDLDDLSTRTAFDNAARGLNQLYDCQPAAVACDLHPDYYTTRWAERQGLPIVQVQHHHAHAVACMVEHDLLDREVLAITWDGTGYGTDGTIWGGEVLRATVTGYRRVASLRLFSLPGGAAAIREPARIAVGLLGAKRLEEKLLQRLNVSMDMTGTMQRMIERGINSPRTSSVGRLFDAVSALVLGGDMVSYEGEAAVWLEAAVDETVEDAYPLTRWSTAGESDGIRGDWEPLVAAVLSDIERGVPAAVCAARFHNALASWAVGVAALHPGLEVVLGGGCFQNGVLLRRVRAVLEAQGRRVYSPETIPPGDGGLAVGQLAVALASL